MIPGSMVAFVPFLLGLFAAQPGVMSQSVTRLVIEDQVILKVPIRPRPLSPQFEWREHKGPKCIAAGAIRGALLSGPQQVDFVLGDGPRRIRAELEEDCPALDFYKGFYLQPQDEQLCAGRDAVHSRIGGSCTIERFKQLVPKFRH